MTDETTKNAAADSHEEEVFETYYDEEESSTGFSFKPGCVFDAAERVHDRFLSALPTDVTTHLGNSHKELLRAGIAMAEAGIKRVDEVTERVKATKEHG